MGLLRSIMPQSSKPTNRTSETDSLGTLGGVSRARGTSPKNLISFAQSRPDTDAMRDLKTAIRNMSSEPTAAEKKSVLDQSLNLSDAEADQLDAQTVNTLLSLTISSSADKVGSQDHNQKPISQQYGHTSSFEEEVLH